MLAAVLAGGVDCAAAQAPARADAVVAAPRPAIAFGAAWYPEQWPESRWETDLQLMQQAGFDTVRIAEFAWSTMEPSEGHFEFAWLDRAIAAASRHSIRVVLGTPTAAPPVWMGERHPDILRVDEDGTRASHGARRHFSYASHRYRAYARRIVREMARRYGHDRRVVGWQLDNEIGPPSFDAEARARWHGFLAGRFGTIAALNRAWSTAYWSQAYQRFDQVPLHASGPQNPGLLLEARHFQTALWREYLMDQAAVLRTATDPAQFITTNTMFWNDGFDHYAVHEGLDLAAWDDYIQDPEPDWVANGANHDLVWGYKQKNFWLMETQAGRVDWVGVNRALRPGQVREMGWQAVMHGADAVLYWQFRPAPNGQETNYGTLLSPDGQPAPVYGEIARLGAEFARAGAALADTTPEARVAMLWSYDSRWAIDLQRMHRDYDPVAEFTDFYRPLRQLSGGVAVLPARADLEAFPLVVAPNLNVLSEEDANHLAAYVRGGGHLVLGPRTGQKDPYDALWPDRQPGPLRATLGASVEQYYVLDGHVALDGLAPADGPPASAWRWAEALVPEAGDVQVLARYRDPGGWLDGRAAVVTRPVGRGHITYVAAWLEPAAMRELARTLMARSGLALVATADAPGLEIGVRGAPGRRTLVAINHADSALPLALPPGASLLLGSLDGGRMAPHDVVLATLPPEATP